MRLPYSTGLVLLASRNEAGTGNILWLTVFSGNALQIGGSTSGNIAIVRPGDGTIKANINSTDIWITRTTEFELHVPLDFSTEIGISRNGTTYIESAAGRVDVTQHLGIAAGKTVDWASGTAALTLGGLTWISSNITTTTVSGDLSVGPSKAVLFPGLTETAALTAGVDADGLTGMVSVSRVGDGGSGYAITDAGSPVVAMAWDGSDGIIQAATGSLHLGGDAGTQLSLSAGLVTVTGDVNIADGYLELGDISATPGTPTDAGRLYVEDGSLKYIGGSGTITPIAPA
jgi:hypothetical protein